MTGASSPWLTAKQAAAYCQTGPRVIYRAAASGQLRAARVGGRRDLRLREDWLDTWLEQTASPADSRAESLR